MERAGTAPACSPRFRDVCSPGRRNASVGDSTTAICSASGCCSCRRATTPRRARFRPRCRCGACGFSAGARCPWKRTRWARLPGQRRRTSGRWWFCLSGGWTESNSSGNCIWPGSASSARRRAATSAHSRVAPSSTRPCARPTSWTCSIWISVTRSSRPQWRSTTSGTRPTRCPPGRWPSRFACWPITARSTRFGATERACERVNRSCRRRSGRSWMKRARTRQASTRRWSSWRGMAGTRSTAWRCSLCRPGRSRPRGSVRSWRRSTVITCRPWSRGMVPLP